MVAGRRRGAGERQDEIGEAGERRAVDEIVEHRQDGAQAPPSPAGSADRRPAALPATAGRRGRCSRRIAAPSSAWSPRSSASDRMHDRRAARKGREARHGEEGEQRRPDAGAAVPVVDQCRRAGQRLVAVADAQRRVMRVSRVPKVKTLGPVGALHGGMRQLADSPPCAASSSRRCRSAAAACAARFWRRRSSGEGTSPSALTISRSERRRSSLPREVVRTVRKERRAGKAAAELRRKPASLSSVALEVARCSAARRRTTARRLSLLGQRLCFLARAAIVLDLRVSSSPSPSAAASASP